MLVKEQCVDFVIFYFFLEGRPFPSPPVQCTRSLGAPIRVLVCLNIGLVVSFSFENHAEAEKHFPGLRNTGTLR